jgi:hypothetical protein
LTLLLEAEYRHLQHWCCLECWRLAQLLMSKMVPGQTLLLEAE